jgi:hypothetical protein
MKHLLTFEEAQIGGWAMHDRWLSAAENDADIMVPPLGRDDCAWGDMFRAAWDAVHTLRKVPRKRAKSPAGPNPGPSLGGVARAASMTAKQRSECARKAARARWAKP